MDTVYCRNWLATILYALSVNNSTMRQLVTSFVTLSNTKNVCPLEPTYSLETIFSSNVVGYNFVTFHGLYWYSHLNRIRGQDLQDASVLHPGLTT